jgi:limonene-1,2-epoxide hydrolase
MNAIDTVMELCAAANARDLPRLLRLFTSDTIYHNMSMAPLRGAEGVRSVMEPFIANSEQIEWTVQRIALTEQGDVFAERTDRFMMHAKWMSLPVVGVFVIRDGRIMLWRDYYDQQYIHAQIKATE